MIFAESILIFLFGLCIGSFLNVVIFRLLSGESLRGRSHCPKCLKTLRWYELVPLFSFIWQKGKCRGCREKISWQYPLVEATTAILFLLIFQHFYGNWIEMILWFVVGSAFMVLFFTDLKEYVLPDVIVIPLIVILFFYRTFQSFYLGSFDFFISFIITSFFIALPFFLFYAISGGRMFRSGIFKIEWMGMGDSKLIFLAGLFLGWPKILIAVMFAVFLGSLWGILLMFLRGFTLKSAMPFGPFIILGAFLSLCFGDIIYRWYIGWLLF
jgi:leader peptidase (prepilin peptidase)/N-methyltransferase